MRYLAFAAILLTVGVAAWADDDTQSHAPPANTPAPPQPNPVAIPGLGSPESIHGSIITNTTQPNTPQNPAGETGGAVGVTIPLGGRR
jgi:hypothetical protein